MGFEGGLSYYNTLVYRPEKRTVGDITRRASGMVSGAQIPNKSSMQQYNSNHDEHNADRQSQSDPARFGRGHPFERGIPGVGLH